MLWLQANRFLKMSNRFLKKALISLVNREVYDRIGKIWLQIYSALHAFFGFNKISCASQAIPFAEMGTGILRLKLKCLFASG